jgi:hypothetical protein
VDCPAGQSCDGCTGGSTTDGGKGKP